MNIESKPKSPAGTYVPARVSNELVFVSNMDAERSNSPNLTGTIGKDVTIEQAMAAARLCADNLFDAASTAIGPSMQITGIVRLQCSLVCADDFTDHFQLADACLCQLQSLTEYHGPTAISTFGVISLPGASAIEVEGILSFSKKGFQDD